MSRDDVERRMRAAEATLQQAAERLETTEKRLGELDQEREAVLGESEIARRALTDLEQAIADLREELASLELEEARQGLADAVAERDATIEQTAAALGTAVALLDQVDQELETEIIDAAARSNAPYAINALPEHLRAVAMERRRKLQRSALDRLQEAQRR